MSGNIVSLACECVASHRLIGPFPVAGGFHSPPGPLTAAALKSKLTSTGAQTRGLLFFYGQNKILKLEVQAQRHLRVFFFFLTPNYRESSKTRVAMMSSCPRYDGDKSNKTHRLQSHQATFCDCSPHTCCIAHRLCSKGGKNKFKKSIPIFFFFLCMKMKKSIPRKIRQFKEDGKNF